MEKIQCLRATEQQSNRATEQQSNRATEQLNDCIRLGNINGKSGGSFAGQVYSKNGTAPTLTDMQGGGRQPHIVECQKLGNIYGFDGGSFDGNVYDSNGLCPTQRSSQNHGSVPEILEVKRMNDINVLGSLTENSNQRNVVYDTEGISCAMQTAFGEGGGNTPLITEQIIVAERGRDKENPNHRGKATENYEQRLEPNKQGMANTITSVEKDNLVLEKKSIKIRQATKDGFIDCEIPGVADLNYVSSQTRRGRVVEGGADKSNSDNGEYP